MRFQRALVVAMVSLRTLGGYCVCENASKDKEVKMWVYCETVNQRLLVILYKMVSYLSRFYCNFGGVSLSSARCKGQVMGLTLSALATQTGECSSSFPNGFEPSLTRHTCNMHKAIKRTSSLLSGMD